MPEIRINDCLLRAIRENCESDIASNLIILLGEVAILDCNTSLGLPTNDNRLDLEATVLSMLILNRFKGDACLLEITNGYEHLYSVVNLTPSATLSIDIPPKFGLNRVEPRNLHVAMLSQSGLGDLSWNNTGLTQDGDQGLILRKLRTLARHFRISALIPLGGHREEQRVEFPRL